ncbi:hypothetical protein BDR03DRAFT_813402, partial [Suillus americanus]
AAHWELDEERELIVFLSNCKSEAGDTLSFKPAVYTDTANHLNALYPTQKGTPKSQLSCKSKWNALKKSYQIVKDIMALSGFSWGDERGVSVTPETSGAWDAYSRVR